MNGGTGNRWGLIKVVSTKLHHGGDKSFIFAASFNVKGVIIDEADNLVVRSTYFRFWSRFTFLFPPCKLWFPRDPNLAFRYTPTSLFEVMKGIMECRRRIPKLQPTTSGQGEFSPRKQGLWMSVVNGNMKPRKWVLEGNSAKHCSAPATVRTYARYSKQAAMQPALSSILITILWHYFPLKIRSLWTWFSRRMEIAVLDRTPYRMLGLGTYLVAISKVCILLPTICRSTQSSVQCTTRGDRDRGIGRIIRGTWPPRLALAFSFSICT